jgi:hypothetical protein
MKRKRLVVELTELEHEGLVDTADQMGISLANLVRQALEFPAERQGVRRQPTELEKKILHTRARREASFAKLRRPPVEKANP